MKEQPHSKSTVFVIDHDASARAALKELFESVGLKVNLSRSGNAFLEAHIHGHAVLLGARCEAARNERSEASRGTSEAEVHIPIIFLTAHGDIHMAVTAMKAGAVDFLTKPFRNQDVLDAVYAALELDGTRRKKEQSSSTIRERFESLSPRERDVVDAGCGRRTQQADRRRIGLERGDREGPSRQSHAQDARKVAGRAGQND